MTIYATPYQVKKPNQTAEKLAKILGEDPAAVLKSLTEESGFSYVAKKIAVPTAARIERLELPGIGELPDTRRTYPQGDIAGQVIGAVGSENEGPDRARGRGGLGRSPAPTANATSSKTRSANRSGSKRSPKPRTAPTSS